MSEQVTSATPSGGTGGADSLYGADYYAHYWGGGGPYERTDQWLAFFGSVADGLIRDFHPINALDAGCAMGFLVEGLRKRGVDTDGFDISDFAISQAHESIAGHVKVASLTDPIERRYDLITCIEVLEHLPPDQADAAVANLCSASDRIVMSSTPGDYGEPTHLNVLQPEDWAVKFAQNGFYRDLDRDLAYLSPWAALYMRHEEQQVDTVRRYDRGWTRLRREAREVRESLIAAQTALDAERERERERQRPVEPSPEIVARLEFQEREIIRLRDTLIGKDRELGDAKGQLASIEDRSKRIAAMQERIAARVPGSGPFLNLLRRFLAGG
jgi:SAM-dependent methyltransferase